VTFNCRYCGTPLETDPSITSATGKRIPLSAGKPHDCYLNPNFRRTGNTKARAAKVEALSRIDDWQIREDAESYIKQCNTRLSHYRLRLVIEEKEKEL
jgi:hypothetical protein